MKAFCYRSGHVMLGHSVPPGAVELADHPNEAELLRAVAFCTNQIPDAEGCPQTVISGVMRAESESRALFAALRVVDALRIIIYGIKDDPVLLAHMTPGAIQPWEAASNSSAEVLA
jgi:hypothetical protein